MDLFKFLDIETISTCNRVCPTCIRNSHPDRMALAHRFTPHILPTKAIREILRQAQELEFKGTVILSHYNEPLMDDRISILSRMVKEAGFYCMFHSNGDFITKEMAGKLDGVADEIRFSLYMNEPVKSKRAEWIKSLFHKTEVVILNGEHIITHFSPHPDTQRMVQAHQDHNCREPEIHCIVGFDGKYLLCCDDVIGNFSLGSFPTISLEQYWFGEKRTKIQADLREIGGRHKHEYCKTCPRS